MAEHNYFYSKESVGTSTETNLVQVDRAMSKLNRKSYPQVDLKGNAQVYLVRITQTSVTGSDNAEVRTNVFTAPNNYVTKAAVKAWHRARVKMLERQGFSLKSLSPYTRNLRMDWKDGAAPANLDLGLYSGTVEPSQFAVEAQLDEDDTAALTSAMLVDNYKLTLLGDHVTSNSAGEPTKYTTVGCNKAWLDARRQPIRTQTADEGSAIVDGLAIDHETNPLYELMAGSQAAEEVAEIIEDDQIKQPPWVNDDHYDVMQAGSLFTAVNSGTAECIVEAPLGFIQLTSTALRSTSDVDFSFEVLDVYDM